MCCNARPGTTAMEGNCPLTTVGMEHQSNYHLTAVGMELTAVGMEYQGGCPLTAVCKWY